MNEIRFIEYLRENTTTPLAHIHCWGLEKDSPQQLGPFITMDFVPGIRLSTFLKRPTNNKDEAAILNPDLYEAILDAIYEQIADYMRQMSLLTFTRIAAISTDHDS